MIQLIEDNTLMINDELLVQLSYADYAYLADVRYRATAAAYTVHVNNNDLGDTKSESYWEFINNYIKKNAAADKADNKTEFDFCNEKLNVNFDLFQQFTATDHMFLSDITFQAVNALRKCEDFDKKTLQERWQFVADYVKDFIEDDSSWEDEDDLDSDWEDKHESTNWENED